MTYEDVAKKWKVNVSYVYRLVHEGKLRRVKLGHRSIRFRPADVEAYEKRGLQ